MNWFNGRRQLITNLGYEILRSLHRDKFPKRIIVGCDSQVIDNKISFVTTVIVLTIGHGGVFFYNKDNIVCHPKYLLLQNRLFEQTYRAVEIAKSVDRLLQGTSYKVEEIHCDLNPNKKYKSNRAVNMCVGYISSNNYKAIIKPDAYAASSIADSLTR